MIFSLFRCTVEQVNHACDVFETEFSESAEDCTMDDVFISGEYLYQSSMYFNGDSGKEIFWYTFQTYEPGEGNCNIKCLEHDTIVPNGHLSRCEGHEFSNIDISICQIDDLGDGTGKYWADQTAEFFDGKTHANAICNCSMWAIKPLGWAEEGDKLYFKTSVPET